MPSQYLKVNDPSLIRGMNSVDDPKAIPDGQCIRLLNAFPGNPPVPRNGCPGVYDTFQDTSEVFYPPIEIQNFAGDLDIDINAYALAMVYSVLESKYYLFRFKPDGSDSPTILGTGELDSPSFGMLKLYDGVYVVSNPKLVKWENDTLALSHKVVESLGVVRDMCITAVPGYPNFTNPEDPDGPFHFGEVYGYVGQFVRRTDAAAFFEGAPLAGMIQPRGITTGPVDSDTFIPGVCIGAMGVLTSGYGPEFTGYISLDFSALDYSAALAQGATHLRIYRTRTQSSSENSAGATAFWLVDLAINTMSYDDKTSDAALSLEKNQAPVGYTEAPASAFIQFHKGRLWLMDEKGMVYYSESVGGGGFYQEDVSQQYPQLFASLFKPFSYFFDCDSGDNIPASGIHIDRDDIYFFKDSKIFALFGGDPKTSSIVKVRQELGCPFPHTLRHMEIDKLGSIIFFISNEGPAILSSGGNIELFSDFKVKELWPDKRFNSELFADLDSSYVGEIKRKTFAFYKDNAIWVFYTASNGSKKAFGYYFNPTDNGVKGAFEVAFANSDLSMTFFADDDLNRKSYIFGKGATYLVLLEFLRDGVYYDISTESEFFS